MKTEAEIQAEIKKKADEYRREKWKRHDDFRDPYKTPAITEWTTGDAAEEAFKSGATLGREIEREQVRELISSIKNHHSEWCERHEGKEVCLSECSKLCSALAKYQAARGDDHE